MEIEPSTQLEYGQHWHMIRQNPMLEDLMNRKSEILKAQAEEIAQAIQQVEHKYKVQLEEWQSEFQVYMSLIQPDKGSRT